MQTKIKINRTRVIPTLRNRFDDFSTISYIHLNKVGRSGKLLNVKNIYFNIENHQKFYKSYITNIFIMGLQIKFPLMLLLQFRPTLLKK
jgi:uncharacterized protein involved in tellurium resistance